MLSIEEIMEIEEKARRVTKELMGESHSNLYRGNELEKYKMMEDYELEKEFYEDFEEFKDNNDCNYNYVENIESLSNDESNYMFMFEDFDNASEIIICETADEMKEKLINIYKKTLDEYNDLPVNIKDELIKLFKNECMAFWTDQTLEKEFLKAYSNVMERIENNML